MKNRLASTSAIFAVILMMTMAIAPVFMGGQDTDATTSSWGSDYTYTLTLNSTTDTSSPITFTLGGDWAGKTNVTAGNEGDFNFDSSGYGPFNSFYALFTPSGEMLGHLDPDDLSKYMDGTSAPITTNNVMWVLPTVYWKVSGNTLTMSNQPSSGGVAYAHTINGHTYNYLAYGVYEGTTTGTYNSSSDQGDNTFGSYSGKNPRVSAMREVMREEAGRTISDSLNTEGGYGMLWNFYQWRLYQLCVYSITGTYAVQDIFGAGAVINSGLSAGSQTGKLNSVGPYSDTGSSASSNGAKAFIENAWGSVWDSVDDCIWWPTGSENQLYLGQNDSSKILDKYSSSSDSKYSTDATTNKTSQYYVTSPANGFAGTVTTTNAIMWGFPSASGGSSSAGTTDIFYVPSPSDSNARLVRVGGYYGDSAGSTGLACSTYGLLDAADTIYGSRLAFVFDADPFSTNTVTFNVNENSFGSVDVGSLTVPDDSVITISGSTLTVNGTTVTATPEDATAQYTYVFSSWSVADGVTVSGDMTITANFTRVLNDYDITIQANNVDYGTVSTASLSNIDYGTVIAVSDNTLTIDGTTITATPEDATAQYTFTFGSWSVSNGDTVSGNMTITATFIPTVNTYNVGILSNNTDYGTVDVGSIPNTPYGSTIALSGVNDNILTLTNILTNTSTVVTATVADPDTYYTYSFDGYTNSGILVQDGDIITGNTSIIANFSMNIHTVIITPSNSNWGSVDLTEIIGVPSGQNAVTNGNQITIFNSTSTATPVTSDAQYTYSFEGWTVNGVEIVSPMAINDDITITAEFERTINTYSVTWKSNDGVTTLETDSGVEYGTQPTYNGDAPTQSATAEYTYTFDGWATQAAQTSGTAAADLPTITGNVTYYAAFSVAANLTFEVASGSSGYGTVSEATLTVPLNSTYEIDGPTLTVGGNTVTATPTPDTAAYWYDFTGWSVEDGDAITPGGTITATFTRTDAVYTVNITDATPKKVTNVPYGTAIDVIGNSLLINGTMVTANVESLFYEFGEWSIEDGTTVTGNMTITFTVVEQGPGMKGLVSSIPVITIVALLLGVVGAAFMIRGTMDMGNLINLVVGTAIAILVIVFAMLPYVS